jgi:hypothetical protein
VEEVHGFKHTNDKTAYVGIFPSAAIFNGVFAAMAERNPAVIGVWNMDGTQQGYVRNTVTDEEGAITSTIERINEPFLAEFNKALYVGLLVDDIVYDENGEIVSSTPPSPDKQVHSLSGWGERDLTEYPFMDPPITAEI